MSRTRALDTALALKKWAIEQSMLSQDRVYGMPTPESATLPDPFASSERVSEILRDKGITFIGVNESKNEIIIYTGKYVPKKALQALPRELPHDVTVTYKRGHLASDIGDEQPQAIYGTPPYLLRNKAHYTSGSSVILANQIGAGTLGCLVADKLGNLYALTNNHVAGGCNFAPTGFPVMAPGLGDVKPNGLDPFTIGHHSELIQMVPGDPRNVDVTINTDAAIFQIADPGAVSSYQQSFYDTPSVTGDLEAGQAVEKVGRTTGHTEGIVRAQIVGAEPVYYRSKTYSFEGHVFFDPLFVIESPNGPFADLGDSGSLITRKLDDGTREAVGIVVAVRSTVSEQLTFALPIGPILKRLNVELVFGHNV